LLAGLFALVTAVIPAGAQAAAADPEVAGAPTLVATLPFVSAPFTVAGAQPPDSPVTEVGGGARWFVLTRPEDTHVSIGLDPGYVPSVFVAPGDGARWPVRLSTGFAAEPGTGLGTDGLRRSFLARGGTTYLVAVGAWQPALTSPTRLRLRVATPPPNDHLSAASPLREGSARPVDLFGSTLEADEPAGCRPAVGSVWYSFTPRAAGTYTVHAGAADSVAAFAGGPTTTWLAPLGCAAGPLTVTLPADRPVWIRVAAGDGTRPDQTVAVRRVPQPLVGLQAVPHAASTLQATTLLADAHDPGAGEPFTYSFDAGDGTAATEPGPEPVLRHRYLRDGIYRASVTATTADGRTASAWRDVSVFTHDVAVDRVDVPAAARPGDVLTAQVELSSASGPERARVDLTRIGPDGQSAVGSRFVSLPPGRRSVRVTFPVSVTAADAGLGRLVLHARATLAGGDDAFPGDNDLRSATIVVR
jgi:hypothetical protein